ncbi:MAG: hypothetical protein Q8J78_05190, partial [Moraxellaceae bacterium]|nr:hypothetical protein [Moraxellaceae bacterium]
MSGRTLLLIAVVLAALFMVDRYQRNPHRTALPFGSTDLSGVQEQLAALPPEERQLVEDYVKRSRGDVLTPALADPDDPLTARTFAEAITLQRAWQARMKVEEARMAKLNAQRDARLAPLRALVDARVVRAETLTPNEFGARRDPNYFPQPERTGDGLIFVTRIQVRNIGNESIVKVKGSLKARDSEAYLPLDLCWIDLGEDT